MLFSPWCYGHHPTYLRHLISYWCQWQLPGTLNIVVSGQFLEEHTDVVELQKKYDDRQSIKFVAITPQEQADLENATSGWGRAFEQYKLISKYASLLKATQGLIIYFDSCQLPLVLGLKLPCPFSGIYYRPTFHYRLFVDSIPTWRERVQHLREQIFLWRLLHHPQFKTLFCLDPLAIEAIARLGNRDQVMHLPDPVKLEDSGENSPENLRVNLGIEPNRQIFLSFGRLSEGRKGVPQLVEAISLLSPDIQQNLCLLFVGEPNSKQLEAWLTPIRQLDSLKIVTRYGYVPESEVNSYFQLADVVLAPYQRHVGMSGILLQAAAANKPVLSSDYGLMGEMIRRYRLGLAVDSTLPSEIAKGLTRFLLEAPDNLCDRTKMKGFAEQNSAERFARIIFKYTILDTPKIL
ncbi:glycosyl transferase family 1 [Brunnivagina elsteri CCALA 953]|uniref:Glycosyl transferase family 1 n=2 Tax=Brunnivagina TaxID=3344733 RepID=A0A2A2TJK1_9CYAN|nr:glycosyl transferase family 1 [Calothrix elsteri CCALA 953]